MWIIFVYVLLIVIYFAYRKRDSLKVLKDMYRITCDMPGPSIFTIFKHRKLVTKKVSNRGLFKFLKFLAKFYTTPFRCWLGGKLYVIVTEPEDLQIILTSQKCINHGDVYDLGKSFAGNGLGTIKGKKWRSHRKLIVPTFNSKTIKSFLPIFRDNVKNLVSTFTNFSNQKTPKDINPILNDLSLDTVFQTTMRKKDLNQKDDNVDIYDVLNNKLAKVVAKRIFNPILHFDPFYRLTKLYRAEKEYATYYIGLVNKVLQEKKKLYENSLLDENNNECKDSSKDIQTFVDQIMKLLLVDKKFNDDDVIGHTQTIIIAGYETVALASSFSILMMAIHTHYQEMIYEEILSAGLNKENIEWDDFSKLDFLDRFIKETLRLFPPLPIIIRKANETFEMGKYTIPTGTNIVCPIFHVHRKEKIWGPNADSFDPDRFLPENLKKIHSYAYIPFSRGPRNCIGIKYANTFLKTILINLVKNFNFRTDLKMDELQLQFNLSLRLGNTHLVYIKKRDN